MNPLQTSSLCVLMPHGADDMLIPSTVTSHSRQPDYLRRHFPADFVPPSLTSSLALEAARTEPTYPKACITGARLGNDVIFLSAAGPGRDLISLSQIPSPSRASAVAALAAASYRPSYTRACAPLLQLALNYKSPEGWERILPHADLPIVAARSSHAVEFWQLMPQQTHQYTTTGVIVEEEIEGAEDEEMEEIEQEEEEEKKTIWRLDDNFRGKLECPVGGRGIADVAWCRHMTQRCAVLCYDGTLLDVALDAPTPQKNNFAGASKSKKFGNNNKSTSTSSVRASVGWMPSTDLLSELPFLSSPSPSPPTSLPPPPNPNNSLLSNTTNKSLKCTFTSLHPRHVLLSLHTRLGCVDLRGTSSRSSTTTTNCSSTFFQEIYQCPAGQWISAISAAPSEAQLQQQQPYIPNNQHYVVASTATHILLFDLRRPQTVLSRWEHGMHHQEDSKVKGLHALRALRSAPPDTLHWLPSKTTTTTTTAKNTTTSLGGNIGGSAGAVGAGPSSQQQMFSASQARSQVGNLPFSLPFSAAAGGSGAGPSQSQTQSQRTQTQGNQPLSLHHHHHHHHHHFQVLATNAAAGHGIVCEWEEHRNRGGIAVAAVTGKMFEYSLEEKYSLQEKEKEGEKMNTANTISSSGGIGGDASMNALEEAMFAWEPAWWNKIKPRQPPLLLFNFNNGYPKEFSAAVASGRRMQCQRAAAQALFLDQERNGGDGSSGGGERGRKKENDDDLGNNSIKEREEECGASSGAMKPVRLLPSSNSLNSPVAIGVAVVPSIDWQKTNNSIQIGGGGGGDEDKEEEEDDKVMLALLSPTQEVVVSLVSGGESQQRHHRHHQQQQHQQPPGIASVASEDADNTAAAVHSSAVPIIIFPAGSKEEEKRKQQEHREDNTTTNQGEEAIGVPGVVQNGDHNVDEVEDSVQAVLVAAAAGHESSKKGLGKRRTTAAAAVQQQPQFLVKPRTLIREMNFFSLFFMSIFYVDKGLWVKKLTFFLVKTLVHFIFLQLPFSLSNSLYFFLLNAARHASLPLHQCLLQEAIRQFTAAAAAQSPSPPPPFSTSTTTATEEIDDEEKLKNLVGTVRVPFTAYEVWLALQASNKHQSRPLTFTTTTSSTGAAAADQYKRDLLQGCIVSLDNSSSASGDAGGGGGGRRKKKQKKENDETTTTDTASKKKANTNTTSIHEDFEDDLSDEVIALLSLLTKSGFLPLSPDARAVPGDSLFEDSVVTFSSEKHPLSLFAPLNFNAAITQAAVALYDGVGGEGDAVAGPSRPPPPPPTTTPTTTTRAGKFISASLKYSIQRYPGDADENGRNITPTTATTTTAAVAAVAAGGGVQSSSLNEVVVVAGSAGGGGSVFIPTTTASGARASLIEWKQGKPPSSTVS